MSSFCELCKREKESIEVIELTCHHTFCWICIEDYLKKNLCPKPKCPITSCVCIFKDRDVRKVLSCDDIQKYEVMCNNKMENKHYCILPECGTLNICKEANVQFDCSNCTIFNCVKCKQAHKWMACNDLISRNGEPRKTVCNVETARAREFLKKKEDEKRRVRFVELEASILVENQTVFTCHVCSLCIIKGAGITLRNCFHNICRPCLLDYVRNCANIPITCPISPCISNVDDRECREILPSSDKTVYERRCIEYASRGFRSAEYCRQTDCSYICEKDDNVVKWTCELCHSENCVKCDAIHPNKTCEEYLESRIPTADELEIQRLIKEKKLMKCLNCGILIDKKSGCNWIKCCKCATELCWINQTYRWGPKGRGDTSGGCKCGVNGIRCHAECMGCIPDGPVRNTIPERNSCRIL